MLRRNDDMREWDEKRREMRKKKIRRMGTKAMKSLFPFQRTISKDLNSIGKDTNRQRHNSNSCDALLTLSLARAFRCAHSSARSLAPDLMGHWDSGICLSNFRSVLNHCAELIF